MSLMQPLLEAMKMDVTVSLDWKCQGSPFAHHLTQLIRSRGLPTFSEPVSQPGLPEIDLTDAMSPGDWSLRSCEGTTYYWPHHVSSAAPWRSKPAAAASRAMVACFERMRNQRDSMGASLPSLKLSARNSATCAISEPGAYIC